MAKPGRQAKEEMARLAAMSRNAADLGGGSVPEALRERLLAQAEGQLGMRCAGCGERITVGFKFTQVDVQVVDGNPVIDGAVLSACNGAGGCDFANKARENASCMEMIEFVWLDAPPAEAKDARRARAG